MTAQQTISNEAFRRRYLEALGIDIKSAEGRVLARRALARAHEIRKFEIELYWKRATYFWAFQATAFAMLGFLAKDGTINYPQLLLPSLVGAITAFAGFTTASGSKFWQENWEAHVDLLESEFEGRLMEVIISRTEPQQSVSRVNQQLMLLLAIGWLVPLSGYALPELTNWLFLFPKNYGRFIPVVFAIGAYALFYSSKSRLLGRTFRMENGMWERHTSLGNREPTIIWRNPIGAQIVDHTAQDDA
jgi:hypothetical protein